MTSLSDTIAVVLDRISALESAIREHINTGRNQRNLLKSRETWSQVCSSLDIIGDTVLCIRDYVDSPYPSSDGLKYIYTYGVLQALFLQQDAVRHLSEAFAVSPAESSTLMRIRDIRNASIGHPTKQKIKKDTHYNYISRMSLSHSGFTLLRTSLEKHTHFENVNVIELIDEQLKDIEVALSFVADKLKTADRLHLAKFGVNLISDIFHPSIGYMFEKVSESIRSSSQDGRLFGLSMLESVENIYAKFKNELEARDEFNEYIGHQLDEYKHAVKVLKDFLTGNQMNLCENDARIYLFYLREQHNNNFAQIADELDNAYKDRNA